MKRWATSAVHLAAARDRAGERDVVDLPRADERGGRVVVERHRRHQAGRHVGAREGVGEVAAAERRQPGVLDQHGVAREQRRHDHVDGDQERIVPGRDVEHDAQRLAADEPVESRLGREGLVGERRLRQPAHRLGAVDHRVDLVPRLLEGLPHLPGDVDRDLIRHGPERGHHLPHGLHAPGHRHPAPLPLGRAGSGDDGLELGRGRVRDLAERRLGRGIDQRVVRGHGRELSAVRWVPTRPQPGRIW